jgi:cytochrome c biogenesis protein ResB
VGEAKYGLNLRHERYEAPFTLTLDKFIRDLHPRTMMAANFESEVTKTDGASSRKVNIRMNEPLRDQGYTFFQASWGPEGAQPGEPLFSTFAVVKNPADQWPKYACYVIGIGMLIHFSQKLAGYIRAQNRRRSA